MLVVDIFLFIASCILLVVSGGWLVKLLIRIASHLRLSDFVVAFLVMALSTSLPELFVGIDSALIGKPSLSLGNVIGANIVNVTLVVGIVVLLGRGLKIKNPNIRKDSFFMFLTALAPVALIVFDKTLSKDDGLILILIFLIYSWHLIRDRPASKNRFDGNERKNFIITLILFILSLGLLFLSARLVVGYATITAIKFSFPLFLVGLFLIALSTTLPELIFGIRAAMAKKADLAIGNTIGSVVCNSTLVLGVAALIYPITPNFLLFLTSAGFMLLILFLFMLFIKKGSLSITHAILLIVMYAIFIIFELYLGRW